VTPAELLPLIGLGVTVFVSTNLDDILLLSVFFADRHLSWKAVVAGQFLGIGALVAASSVAALAALAIPEGWTALLGIVPLGLGLAKLRGLRRGKDPDEDTRQGELRAERRTHSQIFAVAAVTIANGADNLGVYIPLFAKQPSAIPAYAIMFAVLTAAWCLLGYVLVNNPLVGHSIRRYGHRLLPFVLIGLGVYILLGLEPLLR